MVALPAAILGAGVIGALGSVAGGSSSGFAAREASRSQRELFGKQVELAAPAIESRNNALIALADLLGLPRPNIQPFGAPGDRILSRVTGRERAPLVPGVQSQSSPGSALAALGETPGFQFRLDQGNKLFENSAAARGGLLSGSAIRGRERFGQNFATNEFSNRLQQLFTLAGLGQGGTSQIVNAAGQTGSNLANLDLAQGAARSSAFSGATNNLLGGFGTFAGLGGFQGGRAGPAVLAGIGAGQAGTSVGVGSPLFGR